MKGNGEDLPNEDTRKELADFKKLHSKSFIYFLEEFEKYIKLKDKCSAQNNGASTEKVAIQSLLKANL